MCIKPEVPAKEPVMKESFLLAKSGLCVVAACLHFQVFLGAVGCLLPTGDGDRILRIEKAVLWAYGFDMLCLKMGVIPFSRARRPSDIISHHVPVFAFLVIGLPYTLQWSFEPAVEIALKIDGTRRVFERINGWGFMSSLNEAFMCSQQAEIFLKKSLDDRRVIPADKNFHARGFFFTSNLVQLIELAFKLSVFTIFPVFSVLACLEYDIIAWQYHGGLTMALNLLRSPVFLRTLAWRAFIVLQYPHMAKRTYSKLHKHLRDWSSASHAGSISPASS